MTVGFLAPALHTPNGRSTPRFHAYTGLHLLLAAVGLLIASTAFGEIRGRAVPSELLQKAWNEGSVRVIVELGGVNAEPERRLPSKAAVAAQRGRIASEGAALRAALRGLRHRVLRELKTIPYVGLEVDHDVLRLLDALPGLVTRVYESKYYSPALAQSGPLIEAPDVWNAGWDGSGQVIAILDTGVDKNHPFLAAKVVSEACYDSSPLSTCPNGLDTDTSSGAGMPCTFAPECPHGTHVAGIAAGNGPSFDGIAHGASLVAIRVFSLWSCDGAPCALASDIDVVDGLERVLELSDTLPIAAVNMSFAGGAFLDPCDSDDPMMTAAVTNLRTAGVAPVVASGNGFHVNRISSPACISTAISVGATSDGSGGLATDQIMGFSNAAYFLSLLAPGFLINSSVPGGGFENLSGTSMATPHVAGAWALMKQANPDASVDDVLAGLQNTGKPIPDVNVTASRIAFTLLQFSTSAYSVGETADTATITVTRSGAMFGPHFAPLTVDYATSAGTAIPGQDYTETAGTLEFYAGETSKTFTVPILNDTRADGPRKVGLALSNAGGGALLGVQDTAELTIGDNDVAGSVQFSMNAYSVGEQVGTATITVTRSGGSASDVTVQYATGDGTAKAGIDYESTSGTLTFPATGPGATSQTFTVTILDDGLSNGNRTVNLTLHTPGGSATLGGRKTAVLTIVNDDVALQFSQASYSVNEGSGSLAITVTRGGPMAPAAGVTYTVLAGSAMPGADYGGTYTGVLPFAANQPSRTFQVTILNDKLAEGPETFLLQLSNPTGGAVLGTRQTAVATIVDDDTGGSFRFASGTQGVPETATTVSVPVTRSNGSAGNGKVRVVSTGDGTAVPGVHYVAVDQVLSFPADQPSQTVTITLLPAANNATVDALRTIKLALQNPEPLGLSSIGTPATMTVTIGDNDVAGSLQFNQASVNVLESSANAVLMVTRHGGAAMGVGATWEITAVGTAALGTDYAEPASYLLSFDSGPTQPISIPLLNAPGAHGIRTIQVKLKNPTGGAKLAGSVTAMINLLPDTVGFQLDRASYTMSEGTGSLPVTVLRTGPTQTAAAVTVATVDPPAGDAGTAISGTDYTPASRLLTFNPGQTSQSFTVPLKNDMQLDGIRTLRIRLSNPTGGAELGDPSEATATLGEDDLAGIFRFTTGSLNATEGASGNVVVTVTVTRSGGSGGTVEVPWSKIGGTATTGVSNDPGVDVLIAPSGTLTFGPNESNKTIQVTILADSEIEPNETVKLALGTPTPSGALGSPSEFTLVVVDSDRKGTIQFAAPLASVAEANAVVPIAVTRTGNLAQPATVNWTITGGSATRGDLPVADVDYVAPAGGTLDFAAGQATPTVPLTIAVNFDALAEGTETVELALDTPSAGWALGAIPSTTVSLVESTVQFAGLPLIVNEGNGSRTITITRSGITTQPVTVSYTANAPGSAKAASSPNTCLAGDDYRPVIGTQTFSPGQTVKTFNVPLCGDSLVEGDEDLTLTLTVDSGPALVGPPGEIATLTITENDVAGVIQFSSLAYSASEGQGNATLSVTRTGTGLGAQVHWAIVGGTAQHGAAFDYTGPTEGDLDFGTLTSTPIVIPLINTTAADGPRTILVELSNPLPAGLASLGPRVLATLTINDNEPTLRLNSASYVVGETSANLSVTVLRSGPASAPASVTLVPQTLSSATGGVCGTSGVDFGVASIDVQIPAGQGSRTVQVPICQDTWADGPETFGLALQAPVGATLATPASATVTITDNEVAGTVRWSAADASGVEGTTIVLTVTRTGGAASDVTVAVTAHDGDDSLPGADAREGVDYEILTSSPLPFGLNTTSQTVEISLLPRDGVQGPRAFRVTLHAATGGAALGAPSTATVWILDPS